MDRDAEFDQYVADSFARPCRTGYLFCGDWQRAEDAAQSIEFSVKGTVVHRATPATDGSWVAVWRVTGTSTLGAATYTTRAASGAVLATGSLN
jgi:hypothetical protein